MDKKTVFFAALAAFFAGILLGIAMSPAKHGFRFCNNRFFCNNSANNEASIANNTANGRFRPRFSFIDGRQKITKGKKKDKKNGMTEVKETGKE